MPDTPLTRRAFLATGAATLAAAPLGSALLAKQPTDARVPVYIFSKHLQWLDYEDFARTAMDIGYDGVEVTLRSAGHIEPERVEDDLPRFLEACRKENLPADLAATNIVDPNKPLDARVLQAMSKAGMKAYRLGGWRYTKETGIFDTLKEIRPAIRDIIQANRELGLVGYIQNHSGAQYVGSSVWDLYELLRDENTDNLGISFDIGHATVEGGYTWTNHAQLALPLAKSLVIKDFTWQKTPDRGWRARWCPLGEGMVNAPAYFQQVARSSYRGPIMMHFEYPTPGATHVNWYRAHISDQRKDVATLRRWLQEAGLQ